MKRYRVYYHDGYAILHKPERHWYGNKAGNNIKSGYDDLDECKEAVKRYIHLSDAKHQYLIIDFQTRKIVEVFQ